jgi:hypothetical protein
MQEINGVIEESNPVHLDIRHIAAPELEHESEVEPDATPESDH